MMLRAYLDISSSLILDFFTSGKHDGYLVIKNGIPSTARVYDIHKLHYPPDTIRLFFNIPVSDDTEIFNPVQWDNPVIKRL